MTKVLTNKLVKIDTLTRKVANEIPTSTGPIRVKSSIDAKFILVNNAKTENVSVFDTDNMELQTQIWVGRLPIGLTVASTRYAYVAHLHDNKISSYKQFCI